jgi:hypothetical protein
MVIRNTHRLRGTDGQMVLEATVEEMIQKRIEEYYRKEKMGDGGIDLP